MVVYSPASCFFFHLMYLGTHSISFYRVSSCFLTVCVAALVFTCVCSSSTPLCVWLILVHTQLSCFFFFFFFPLLAVSVAFGNSWARDRTQTTAVTRATAVTMLNPKPHQGTPKLLLIFCCL